MKTEEGVLLKYEGNEKEPVIPIEVKEIGEDAFLNCTSLETILIPENVKQIGKGAFAGCTNLKHVYLTSAVLIKEHAFKDCGSLEWLYIPYHSIVIPAAFENCNKLLRVFKWDSVFHEVTGPVSELFPDPKYKDTSPHMSDVLPECTFIRCNNLLKESYAEEMNEVIRFVEEREEKYRNTYGDGILAYGYYDDYDPLLSEGKKVTLIGCGKAGVQLLDMVMPELEGKDVYTAVIGSVVCYPEFRQFPQHIALYEGNRNCQCGGIGPGGSPDQFMPDAVTYLHKYLPIIRNSRKIFLAGGAAGPTAHILTGVIASCAKYYGIPLKAFLTDPFQLEGKKRKKIAERTLENLERLCGRDSIITDELRFEQTDVKQLPTLWEMKKQKITEKLLEALSEEGVV